MNGEVPPPASNDTPRRKYSLLQAPFLSFFSRDFHRDVALHWRGAAHVYLLVVLAVCWLPTLANVYGNWEKFMSAGAKELLADFPAVTVADGVVSSDVPQPHYIRSPETGKPFVILDTTGKIESLEGTDAQVLVTRNRVFVKKGAGETRIYDLANVRSFRIDRDRVAGWLKASSVLGPPAFYVLMIASSFAYRVMEALILAAVALGLRRPGPAVGYAGVVSLAAVAVATTVVIKTIFEVAHITFPFRETILWCVAFAVLYQGLRASSVAAPAGTVGT